MTVMSRGSADCAFPNYRRPFQLGCRSTLGSNSGSSSPGGLSGTPIKRCLIGFHSFPKYTFRNAFDFADVTAVQLCFVRVTDAKSPRHSSRYQGRHSWFRAFHRPHVHDPVWGWLRMVSKANIWQRDGSVTIRAEWGDWHLLHGRSRQ